MITVPAVAGFAAVEGAIGSWSAQTGSEWYFGNVYDEDDRLLNWWIE